MLEKHSKKQDRIHVLMRQRIQLPRLQPLRNLSITPGNMGSVSMATSALIHWKHARQVFRLAPETTIRPHSTVIRLDKLVCVSQIGHLGAVSCGRMVRERGSCISAPAPVGGTGMQTPCDLCARGPQREL